MVRIRMLKFLGQPIIVKIPQMAQITRDMLTLPVDARTPVGDTKIPLPIIQPIITPQPFSNVSMPIKRVDQVDLSNETPDVDVRNVCVDDTGLAKNSSTRPDGNS